MNILYVSKASVVAAHRDKVRALSRHVNVTMVVPARWGRQPVEPADPKDPPVQFRAVRLSGYNHFHVYRHAYRLVRDARPDLVHIDEEPYSAVTGQFAFHCRRLGIPCCFFAAQNLPVAMPAPFRWLRSRVFRSVAGGLAGTEAAGEVLRGWGFRGRLAVIPQMGVDPDRFLPCPAARARTRARLGLSDAFVVGFGGRLVPEKGLPHLVRAMVNQPADTRLLLLGEGPERGALERQVRAAGLGDRVHFAGHVPSTAMPEWLVALDALVLPSIQLPRRMEQFGRILIEAMACGVPVIGSSCGEIPRVIGEAGIVVPEADSAAIAAAITQLRSDPARGAALGAAGRHRVIEHFANDGIAAATAAFYASLTAAA